MVNIGSKSDGVIPRSEFRDMPELKLNDIVKVYVEEQENVKGQLILSRRKAKLMDAWDNIQKALDNDDVLEGYVKRRTKGGGILFSSMLALTNLIGLIILSFWFFNTSGNQQQAGQNFVERISSLEESILTSEKTFTDLSQNIDSDLKFINKEVRKLWDLSNKKNRKDISKNLNSVEALITQLEEMTKKDKALTAKQRALGLELAKIANIQEQVNLAMDGLNSDSTKGTKLEKISEIEESLDSFNAYRLQVNQSLIAIKEKLNELELIIADSPNE